MTTTATPPITIIRHAPPDPADIEPGRGWCGVAAAIIAGRVIGELWHYIDTDGAITHDAEINIDGHGDSASLVKLQDPVDLRRLATVACLLAHELDAVTNR
ncbi:hypothetical protein MYCO108962_23635 [Mycobacterium colombiense]|uniref:Uncharacterized protein n=1 Tax=Mycobacterium colombiense CECT 3035 TaxID=1041522 RepID=J4JU65_9MYCO|nr:hypothetical protein [Mycobacterium colombiense]EJO86747.1 hypothetical protein MCOL_V222598 [Mycobacterium colombiense CECT 3035]